MNRFIRFIIIINCLFKLLNDYNIIKNKYNNNKK